MIRTKTHNTVYLVNLGPYHSSPTPFTQSGLDREQLYRYDPLSGPRNITGVLVDQTNVDENKELTGMLSQYARIDDGEQAYRQEMWPSGWVPEQGYVRRLGLRHLERYFVFDN